MRAERSSCRERQRRSSFKGKGGSKNNAKGKFFGADNSEWVGEKINGPPGRYSLTKSRANLPLEKEKNDAYPIGQRTVEKRSSPFWTGLPVRICAKEWE